MTWPHSIPGISQTDIGDVVVGLVIPIQPVRNSGGVGGA